jgi:aspartate aminotransferase
MSISQKVKQNIATGSWIRKMFEEGLALKKQYGNENVFDLSIGNPIIEPPQAFNVEMQKLASNPLPGMHRYMENAGYPETRKAVAAQLSLNTGIKFTSDSIVMTCGTAGALNITFKAILNPGEEVIIFAPYFFEYDSFVDNHGGIIKVIPSDENFIPQFNLLESGITNNTKAVIINSPNNPTGVVYSDDVLERIAVILNKKAKEFGIHIFVVSDDVYCRIVYDGITCPRIPHYYPDSIIVTSFSKDLALPGDRIGYAAVHPDCAEYRDVVRGLIYATRTLGYVNAPALLQHLVRNLQDVSVPMDGYQKRRDFLYNNLTQIGYKIVKPQGAFYLFPKAPINDDVDFIQKLKKFRILAVPGRSFKAPGYFRISYCTDEHTISGCLDGFEKAIHYS